MVTYPTFPAMVQAIVEHVRRTGSLIESYDDRIRRCFGFRSIPDGRLFYVGISSCVNRDGLTLFTPEQLRVLSDYMNSQEGRDRLAGELTRGRIPWRAQTL